MTKNHSDNEIPELDAFFAAARPESTALPCDLMNRILSDAATQQTAPHKGAACPAPPRPWWRSIADALGGWQAAGALTACAVLGLWIGYAAPDGLSGFSELVTNSTGITAADDDYLAIDDILAEI